MSKPEDIPQDVWDTARHTFAELLTPFRYEAAESFADAEHIARAIMAAKAEEREAVKHWFTREAEINDELETQIVEADGKGWHKHFADVQRRNVDAIDAGRHVEKYAAAIRKRGEA